MKKGILKNCINVFRRYKNPYLSIEDRFIKPEKKSSKWLNALNKNLTDKSIKGYFQFLYLVNVTKLSFFEGDVLFLIDKFTKDTTSKEELNELIEKAKKIHKKKIEDVKTTEEDNKIEIKLKGKKDAYIKAAKLTWVYPELKKMLPLLLTDERDQKCHGISLGLLCGLPNAHVVTGKIYTCNRQATYLHSWIENEIDGKTYVLDGEINALMRKKDFYKLYHVKPLERISHKQYMEDMDIVKPLWDKYGDRIKLYLTSRDEFMEKAKKPNAEELLK